VAAIPHGAQSRIEASRVMSTQQAGIRGALIRCGWLTAAAVGLWAAMLFPANLVAGSLGIEGLTIAALLCLVPGCLVFIIAAFFTSTGTPLAFVVLAGTGLRMLTVLVGVLVLQSLRPELGMREFTVWAVLFYLAMLLTETLLIVRSAPDQSVSGSASGT